MNISRGQNKSACETRSSINSGFTLVEVVIALAILSLIMVATISALRTFGKTQASLTVMTDRVDEIRTVSSFLRDTFESAVVGQSSGGLSSGGGSTDGGYLFGTENTLDWRAFVQFGEEFGGALLLRLESSDNSLKLRWQDIPTGSGAARWEETPQRVLVEDLQELEIAYRETADSEWQPQWSKRGSPALVRMTLKAHNRFWPELIFRVQR